MENFKFKKPIVYINHRVLRDFNQRFKSIESDVFYTDKGVCEGKKEEYEAFIEWMKTSAKEKTYFYFAIVYCPYTHKIIKSTNFPSLLLMIVRKRSSDNKNNGNKTNGRMQYQLKANDIFDVDFKDKPSEQLSLQAQYLFFEYWSYDLKEKVNLSELRDGSLVQVASFGGVIYRAKEERTIYKELFFEEGGFYVISDDEKRIYFPCPDYPSLQENLALLDKGESPNLDSNNLPTFDERIQQAIAFRVLDEDTNIQKGDR